MDQAWFEMKDYRQRRLANSVWIPLRAMQTVESAGKWPHAGFKKEFLGVGTLAVSVGDKEAGMTLNWDSVGIRHEHGGVVQDGRYIPADVYEGFKPNIPGLHLVLHQRSDDGGPREWHLHQDLAVTLGLRREGDIWIRPSEGHIEVVKLTRTRDGVPCLLECRASHLRDYLCARGMGLMVTAYRDRSAIVENADFIQWSNGQAEEQTAMERWQGFVTAMSEDGRPYGSTTFVMHVAHTGIDPHEDVPVLPHPSDGNFKSASWTRTSEGAKLYRVSGQVWKNEWIDPAAASPIVRGDDVPSSVAFIIDAEGRPLNADALVDEGRWLWFKPTVIEALINRRGGKLEWFTRETGEVACLTGYGVHFGLNSLGLVNAYAKDVALLPEWQKRIWAAHNVGPEGGVSEELRASQIDAEPANTQAPEAFFESGLQYLQEAARSHLGIRILREHEAVAKILPTIHRFRATDKDGLLALAKDIARVTVDDIDAKQVQAFLQSEDRKLGSLKSLEKLLAQKMGEDQAHRAMAPLFGIYELRLADAHLPKGELERWLTLARVELNAQAVQQGEQLLGAAVGVLWGIARAIERGWPTTAEPNDR